MKVTVSILATLLVLLSCKKDVPTVDLGYNYVPLDSGRTLVYQVRDIFHDEALVPANDTDYYQIKTVFGVPFMDEIGDEAVKIRRFLREDETQEWTIKDVWTIKNTQARIEIVEENNRLIDFVFAPSLQKTWDANALNSQDEKRSQFTSVHKAFSINGFSFDSTCTVTHQDFTSFIDYNKEYDIFAKGIGKVYSVVKELRIDNFDTLDISKGFELEYQLIDYSK